MANARKKNLAIPVGSAYAYCMEFTGTIPDDAEIETEENHLGDIESGLTISYNATSETLKDDFGNVVVTILTEEEAKAKLGLITWDNTTLEKLVATARVVEDTAEGVRIIKIGGMNNDNGKQYLFRFVQVSKNKKLGDLRITIVGTNTGGFELAYTKDAATKIEPEITAVAADDEGTLIMMKEKIPTTTQGE